MVGAVTLGRLYWNADDGWPLGHLVGLDHQALCGREAPATALGAGPPAYCKGCADGASELHRRGQEMEFLDGSELLALWTRPAPYSRARVSGLAERER